MFVSVQVMLKMVVASYSSIVNEQLYQFANHVVYYGRHDLVAVTFSMAYAWRKDDAGPQPGLTLVVFTSVNAHGSYRTVIRSWV